MIISQNLQNAIEKLYAVFAIYPLKLPVMGCDGCITREDIACLESKPLRKLTKQDMEKYTRKALTTWGDTDDFRHFLPRIFELALSDAEPFPFDIECISGKLAYGNWSSWPEGEQHALRSLFHTLWVDVINQPDKALGSWLCAFGPVESDLTFYLDTWFAGLTTETALRNFLTFLDASRYRVRYGQLRGAFGSLHVAQASQIANWLKAPRLRESLEAHFFASDVDSPYAANLAVVIDRLYELERNG
jgi:hypothetical protein